MKNKVLIKLVVPELNEDYDVFIPVNEVVWKIKKLVIKSVADLSGHEMGINDECILINQLTGKIYDNNDIVHNTDIRNGTELIMYFKNESTVLGRIL